MGTQLSHIFDSLGWALVHSLWQGTLAFLALYLLRSFTKDKSSALRVSLGLMALIGCFIAFAATFAIYMKGAGSAAFTGGEINFMTAIIAPADIAVSRAPSGAAPLAMFGIYTPLLGLVWCLGFAALSLRYVISFNMTQRLRKTGLSEAPGLWTQRFQTLARNSGVYKRVELYISEHVSGPLTLGFFKPVVLVPASFLTQLPIDQIEAILLHEIAHIRRHDYLINLLQTAIKTVFFFHPAIHLISRRIDLDREHACDDYAVAQSRDPKALVKGLAALRLSLTPQPFTMAAADTDMPLLTRLKRLTGQTRQSRKAGQSMMPLLTLFIFAAMIVAALPLSQTVEATEAQAEKTPAHIEREQARIEAEQVRQETLKARNEHKVEREVERETEREIERATRQAEREHSRAKRDAKRKAKKALRNAKHEKFRTDLTTRLVADGYIANTDSPIEVIRKNGRWVVNGTPIASNIEYRYCKIFENAHIFKTDKTKIVMSPDSFAIMSTSVDGQSHNNIKVNTKTSGGHHTSTLTSDQASFQNPTTGTWISQKFENRAVKAKAHRGVDLAGTLGTPVTASASGTVYYTGEKGDWGNVVKIKHENGFTTHYGHLDSIAVSSGQVVTTGETIGRLGSTGKSTGPHLHFEIHHYGHAKNPQEFTAGL